MWGDDYAIPENNDRTFLAVRPDYHNLNRMPDSVTRNRGICNTTSRLRALKCPRNPQFRPVVGPGPRFSLL
jgi:hypothetical protein